MADESSQVANRWVSRFLHATLIAGLLALIGFRVYGYFAASEGDVRPARSLTTSRDIQEVREVAGKAFSNRDWATAAEALETIVERDPGSMPNWARLAYAQHMLARYDPAIAAYLRVCQFDGRPRQWALRNIAAVYALQHETQMALDYLREAVESGYRQRESEGPLAEDPDFVSLTDHPDFQQLAELTKPLSQRQVYRRLDFLIGKWTLHATDSRRVGFAEFEASSAGYAIVGQWLDNGRSARSTILSYYDPACSQWKQVWLNDHGTVFQLSGGIDVPEETGKERVLLNGQAISADGHATAARATLEEIEEGGIHLVLSSSPDEGQNWTSVQDVTLVPQLTKRASSRATDAPAP